MTSLARLAASAAGVLLWVVAPCAAQDQTPRSHEEMHRLHRDPKAYIAMLEDPKRDAYQKPHEVVTALGLKPGETLADIGSGSGYFALRFAAHVGEQGRVFAVDVDPEMVRHLNRRIRDAGVRNVQTVLADPDDPLLPDASLDRFVVVNTWHHIGQREDYARKLHDALKPGGAVLIVDFTLDSDIGPPKSHRLTEHEVMRELSAAGFETSIVTETLPKQYLVRGSRKP